MLKPNEPNAANTTINEIYVQEHEIEEDAIQVKYSVPPSRYLDYDANFHYSNDRYPMKLGTITNIVRKLNDPLSNRMSQQDNNQFEHIKTIVDKAKLSEFHAASNKEFRPCPTMRKDQRDYILITGNSGCGKSTVAAQFAEMFNYSYPTFSIYLITEKPKDPKFDVFPFIKRIPKEEWESFIIGAIPKETKKTRKRRKYNEDEAEEVDDDADDEDFTTDISEYQNSLYIFDDIEDIMNPKLQKLIRRFKDLLVRVGRSYNIHIIWCNHIMMDRNNTSKDLQEATAIFCFPKDSTTYHFEKFLIDYLNIDKYNVQKITQCTDRWVMFYKYQPRACVSQNKVWVIKPKPSLLKKMK
jgi:energy-coupling factor transporter ATP-binding protein EcfA2